MLKFLSGFFVRMSLRRGTCSPKRIKASRQLRFHIATKNKTSHTRHAPGAGVNDPNVVCLCVQTSRVGEPVDVLFSSNMETTRAALLVFQTTSAASSGKGFQENKTSRICYQINSFKLQMFLTNLIGNFI